MAGRGRGVGEGLERGKGRETGLIILIQKDKIDSNIYMTKRLVGTWFQNRANTE